MPNFVFGQRARGNVFSLQDVRAGNAASRRRTPVSANPYGSPSCAPSSSAVPGGMGSSGSLTGSGGYQINRFNPAYDRLEEGSVIEDWIPRDLAGINKMFRIIYARDAICGPAIDIMSNLPWSEFDIQGIEDPALRRFYEDAAQIFGDKAQEMPAMTTEFLVLGRFCASLLYSEDKGYWTDFVPHDSDFLTITPIPVRGFDPKLDLMLSPGNRQFINSLDYRDQAAVRMLPEHLIKQMRSGQPLPLDPLNTLYLHRKTSPTDFVGTSLLCVTGDSLISTADGLIRIDEILETPDKAGEVEMEATVATIGGGGKTAKTSHWVYSGVGEVIEVCTDLGYSVSGTHDHPILILDQVSLGQEWKKLKDVKIGDMVAVALDDNLWPQEPLVLDEVINSIPTRNAPVPAKEHILPREMTAELAVVLGYLVSEGHIGRRMEFGNTDKEVIEDFRSNFMQAFPDAVLTDRVGNLGMSLLTCYSVKILAFLRSLLSGTTTATKEVPWSILRSTKEHAAAFLSGMFEGDGSAKTNACTYYSSNETLLHQLQILLLKFGIVSRLSPVKTNRQGAHGASGTLTIQGVFRDRFIDEAGFRSSTKKRFDENRHKRTVVTDINTRDFCMALLDCREADKNGRYRNDNGDIVQTNLRTDLTHFHANVVGRNQKAMAKLRLVSEASANRIEALESLGYLWRPVAALNSKGPQPVYDWCVPETEAFVANGIYVHNTRILPFWALEKALMNATVTAARRRASNILHLTIGLDEKWEPTQEEMEDVAGLFIQADEDPVGAVVATRTGVEASEIRDAGSLWKWSDEWSNFAEGKMRGLGISEALLAGDATYNNMDQAKSTFVEQVKTMREALTQGTYHKLFKILARAHGFRKRKKADLDHRVRTDPAETPPDEEQQVKIQSYEQVNLDNLTQHDAMEIPEDDLIVPKLRWRKSLEPEGDSEYLSILESIADKGVPIPLRVWAARAGYDLDEAMEMLEDDAKLREKIVKWKESTAGEDDAFGAVDAPPEEPFWDVGQRFLQLHKDDAKSCVQELVNICHQPGKAEVLADTDFVQRVISKHVRGSDFKRELMNYVLMRMGVVSGLPLSDETVTAIVEHYAKSGYSAERKANEFRFLARLTGDGSRVSAANVEKLAAASLRLVSDKNSELGAQVRKSIASPAVAPTAPTLLSGSTR